MSDTVKLIIEIPEEAYNVLLTEQVLPPHIDVEWLLIHGIPLDSNSERAEVQAYFDGQAYGWEEGRKALIDELKVELERDACDYGCDEFVDGINHALEIIDKYISKTESEDT